jgi:hypothetical protein
MATFDNVPPDKIEESHIWRDWFFKVATFIKGFQQQPTIPSYTTAGAPTAKDGGLYFDTTLNKLRVGQGGTWHTITSA